ncbi:hypothetical protein BXZ70DRAFT_985344 [Cristinia sonorae]|uniref:Ribosomal RNA methyltransferase FtsJ domain-containing protein n=1 Tax=Cristinia sonorae TaxID=1940300 RepID=A0A8K0UTS9_9AGAR|nr:hypothetical protein BXZ70DRAFT_985344 [Cristinia sonorae]
MSLSTSPIDHIATALQETSLHDPAQQALQRITKIEQVIHARSPIFARLLDAKNTYRAHPAVEERFQYSRARQHATIDAPNYGFRVDFENVINFINGENGGFLQGNRVARFLDLGCAPGGFSNWILDTNLDARGVGVNLPDDEAKIKLDDTACHLRGPRYQVILEDVIRWAKSCVAEGTNPTLRLARITAVSGVDPINGSFDLVLGGAFPTMQAFFPWWHRTQLSFSQVFIAFSCLREGGSFILVTSSKPYRSLIELLALLRLSFATVTACKGPSHKTRSSSYLVCRGFHSQGRRTAINSLRSALMKLDNFSRLPPENDNEGGYHNERSQSFLFSCSDEELLRNEQEFFLKIFEPQWKAQLEAIENDLRKLGTHSL